MAKNIPTISISVGRSDKSEATSAEWIARDTENFLKNSNQPFIALRDVLQGAGIDLEKVGWVWSVPLDEFSELFIFVREDSAVWQIELDLQNHSVLSVTETRYEKGSNEFIDYIEPAIEYFESKNI